MLIQNSSSLVRLIELCHTYEELPSGQVRAEIEMSILDAARRVSHEYHECVETSAEVISLDLRRAKFNLEKNLIQQALSETGGNKSHAAKLLGITREGLRKAMKKAV